MLLISRSNHYVSDILLVEAVEVWHWIRSQGCILKFIPKSVYSVDAWDPYHRTPTISLINSTDCEYILGIDIEKYYSIWMVHCPVFTHPCKHHQLLPGTTSSWWQHQRHTWALPTCMQSCINNLSQKLRTRNFACFVMLCSSPHQLLMHQWKPFCSNLIIVYDHPCFFDFFDIAYRFSEGILYIISDTLLKLIAKKSSYTSMFMHGGFLRYVVCEPIVHHRSQVQVT